MVHDAADVPVSPASLDSVKVVFDEQRLVSDEEFRAIVAEEQGGG